MTPQAVHVGYNSAEYAYSTQAKTEVTYVETSFGAEFAEEKTGSTGKHVLGIGFLRASSNHAYGMTATYSGASTSDNPIINVLVTKGQNNVEKYEINIKEIDASNATDIEIFALCSYADATGNGIGGTFSSWQAVNYYRINAEHLGQFDMSNTVEKFATLKQNWTDMVSSMVKHYMDAGIYDQVLDGNKLLQMFGQRTKNEEQNSIERTHGTVTEYIANYQNVIRERIEELSEKIRSGETDASYQIGAQSYTEKEWDKLMSDYDAMQDAIKELMRDRHAEREEKLEAQEKVQKEIQEDTIESKIAMKASIQGTEYYVCSDALFSVCHVPTGETANIYKADDYTEDNPVYLVKGRDINGNDYEHEINVNKIDPNNCSYIELLTWSVHTGNATPDNYLKLSRMRSEAGESSYLDKINYAEIARKLMEEMKTVGALKDYLEYKMWLEEFERGEK